MAWHEADPPTDADGRDDDDEEEPELADSAPQGPRFGLTDHALGDQRFLVTDDEVKEVFGRSTLEGLRRRRTRWAARFSGDGLDGPSADPLKTAALIRRLAITTRWMANGLYRGNWGVPGFVLGAATRSIVLEFALAPDEEPGLPIWDSPVVEYVELAEGRHPYPTVEGGRYIATLLASADDDDQLVKRLGVVGKRAVLTYQGALKEFVRFGAQVDLLVPGIEEEEAGPFRRVTTPPEGSKRELEVLDRVPEEISETFEVEGLLYTQNSLSTEFGIRRDTGQHIVGEYDLRVADKLGPAWDKRVWARIQETGPAQEWMPRAGRVQRTLIDVIPLRAGETRLS